MLADQVSLGSQALGKENKSWNIDTRSFVLFWFAVMVGKDLSKEILENAAALKIKIEKYYEQLGKQNSDRESR